MAQPIVSWYNVDNTAQETQWQVGTIDAGTISPSKTFLIWNNRAGGSAVSDMTNCAITTKDASGGNTGELVINKWVEAKVETLSETTYTPIGGTVTKAIKAGGTAPAQTIKGAINDGTMANAANNFAKVALQVNIPAVATAGNYSFLTRVTYQYV